MQPFPLDYGALLTFKVFRVNAVCIEAMFESVFISFWGSHVIPFYPLLEPGSPRFILLLEPGSPRFILLLEPGSSRIVSFAGPSRSVSLAGSWGFEGLGECDQQENQVDDRQESPSNG